MKRTTAVLTMLSVCLAASALAAYSYTDRGTWPSTWPKQLEPLRQQSISLEHMDSRSRHYGIRFSKRSQVEAAWRYLLKVRSKGAPIFLSQGENFFLGEKQKAGIVIHCPRIGHPGFPTAPETPVAEATNPRERWRNTTYLEVVVDDKIVDWKSLPVPKGTIIIDERARGKDK